MARRSRAPEFFRVHFFSKRHDADQVMRRFRKRWRLRFRRKQVEATINLKCVGADNLRANFPRDIGCNFGFSGCCRADDKECARHSIRLKASSSRGCAKNKIGKALPRRVTIL